MIALAFTLSSLCQLALSKTAYYEWYIEWLTRAPDGFSRPVISINGEWPCPEIHVDIGDRVQRLWEPIYWSPLAWNLSNRHRFHGWAFWRSSMWNTTRREYDILLVV
jgi:hypothetical protein